MPGGCYIQTSAQGNLSEQSILEIRLNQATEYHYSNTYIIDQKDYLHVRKGYILVKV